MAKSHVASHFNNLDPRSAVLPLMMSLSVDSHDHRSHVAPHFDHLYLRYTVVSMASHAQKSHRAPHFDCLDLINAMVPLMMPSASCDADTGTNGIT